MGEEAEQVIGKLRKTRKAFLLEYLCALSLLGMAAYSTYARLLPLWAVYTFLGIALVALFSAELARLFVRYDITHSKIIVVKGYLKQSKKNVYFHSLAYVPDMNVSQTAIQRLLNYGKVYVHGGGLSEAFEINDINNPQAILKQMEQLVKHTRK